MGEGTKELIWTATENNLQLYRTDTGGVFWGTAGSILSGNYRLCADIIRFGTIRVGRKNWESNRKVKM